MDWNERKRMRSARMPIRSAVVLSRGGNAWSSEVLNISASGVLVGRPQATIARGFSDLLADLERAMTAIHAPPRRREGAP